MAEEKKMQAKILKLVVKGPRVTEKTAILTDKKIYTFEVAEDATKNEISKEIAKIYNVKVLKVNIARTGHKRVFSRGRIGKKSGVKKAYVQTDKEIKIM